MLGVYRGVPDRRRRDPQNLITRSGRSAGCDLAAVLEAEAERVIPFSRPDGGSAGRGDLRAGPARRRVVRAYEERKALHGLLDYDDLIADALELLRRPGVAPWVLFKLDGGLDHILIDEAQDTNPEQWADRRRARRGVLRR